MQIPDPLTTEMARTVRFLLQVARENDPQMFRGILMGGCVGNVLAALPNAYWAEFTKIDPCGEPMCNCHLLAEQCMPALKALRADVLEHRNPPGIAE